MAYKSMAYTVMAYIVVACMVTAYIVMAIVSMQADRCCLKMAYTMAQPDNGLYTHGLHVWSYVRVVHIVMAYIVVVHIVMADIVMVHIVMACIVMAIMSVHSCPTPNYSPHRRVRRRTAVDEQSGRPALAERLGPDLQSKFSGHNYLRAITTEGP